MLGERRGEPRFAVSIPAKVKSLDPVTSIGPSTSATVVEISRNGLRLRAPRTLLPGTVVQIMASKKILLGKVKHCRPSGEDFLVGVRLTESLLSVPGLYDDGVSIT